jgi:hypothetical protein
MGHRAQSADGLGADTAGLDDTCRFPVLGLPEYFLMGSAIRKTKSDANNEAQNVLSFRSAAVSREESAVKLPEADSSQTKSASE